jgi:hypothetical protein
LFFFYSQRTELIAKYTPQVAQSEYTEAEIYADYPAFLERWSSYSRLLAVAGGEPTRLSEAAEMPTGDALAYLMYLAEKNGVERAMLSFAKNIK